MPLHSRSASQSSALDISRALPPHSNLKTAIRSMRQDEGPNNWEGSEIDMSGKRRVSLLDDGFDVKHKALWATCYGTVCVQGVALPGTLPRHKSGN